MAGKKRKIGTGATKTSDLDESLSMKKARVDPLAVPELLTHVFSLATRSTLRACALVCKQWSEIALDELWKDLDSLFPLLELVTSLELLEDLDWESHTRNASQVLSSELCKADWSRFYYYSNRVRSLSYDHEELNGPDTIPPDIAPEAIATLCLHLPSHLDFFSRLETITWATDGSATPVLPFLSPHVKFLDVELTGGSQSANDFFHALAGRTPNLKEFTLRTPITAMDIERSLQKAVRTWKNLETLVVPPYYLRPDIMGAVALLPNLTHLEHDYSYQVIHDEAAMLQELPENAFPKLQTFEFNSNPIASQRLIQKQPSLFSNLTRILIDSAESVNEEEVLKLVAQLGRECVRLTCISLNMCLGLVPPRQETHPLLFRVIESLFPCQQLTLLQIAHPYPLTLNRIQVRQMAAAWPKLETFNLCTEPNLSLLNGDMGNSLSILTAFAKHFPMMETLGLYFAKNRVFNFSGDLYPEFEFRRLEKLDIGVSAVPRGRLQDVGFLIASLCRQMPKIGVGPSDWSVETDHADWETYRSQWVEVKRSLKFAMRIKVASRAKPSRAVT